MEKGWKKVYASQAQYQAQIAKDVLIQNNIDAVIMNHHDSSYHFGEYEVFVREDNSAIALDLLKELKQ